MKGLIFDVQRFSIHDGPGIRTTVFLKGCPLRCVWCHNPESQSFSPDNAWMEQKCAGCGRCVSQCPEKALTLREGKIAINRSLCKHCFTCTAVCPTGAWKRYGVEIDTDALVSLLLRDRRYYEKSGGGVTVSGGEPLSQAAFVAELFEKCHKESMHTAIETSLFGSAEAIRSLLPLTDDWMVDIKHMDNACHEALCGVPVTPILSHIELLSQAGAQVLIRVPVIVGESGTRENIRQTAAFLLNKTNFRRIELLPMHKLASHKYASLSRAYPAENYPIPESVWMDTLRTDLTNAGLTVIRQDI